MYNWLSFFWFYLNSSKTTKWITIKFGAQLLHRVVGLSEKGLKNPTGSRFTKGKEYRHYTLSYETEKINMTCKYNTQDPLDKDFAWKELPQTSAAFKVICSGALIMQTNAPNRQRPQLSSYLIYCTIYEINLTLNILL